MKTIVKKPLKDGRSNKFETKAFADRRLALREETINLYEIHHTCKKVSELLKIDDRTVSRILKEAGVLIKGRGFASQKVFKDPFISKSVEDKSYWLGFIAGDGYLHPTKYSITVTSADTEIIENYKSFIGEGLSNSWVLTNGGKVYTAVFSHKDTHNYLTKRGITSKKSLTLQFKVKLNWSIIRGLFDADGSFSQNRFKITSGSDKAIEQLEVFFNKEGFKTTIANKGTKSNCKDIYVLGGVHSMRKLYELMYTKETNYCLTRKKEQIRRYIQ